MHYCQHVQYMLVNVLWKVSTFSQAKHTEDFFMTKSEFFNDRVDSSYGSILNICLGENVSRVSNRRGDIWV